MISFGDICGEQKALAIRIQLAEIKKLFADSFRTTDVFALLVYFLCMG